jgi:hypothetical protein
MQLTNTGLETADLGQGNPTPLNNANWILLDALLYCVARFVKTGTIDGNVAGVTTLNNTSGKIWLVRRIIIVPVTFTAVTAAPQIECGENAGGTGTLVAMVAPTLGAGATQDLTMLNPRPTILNGGSLKVKVDTAATGTTYQFQAWAEVLTQ